VLYAIYKLSKGKYFEKKEKLKEINNENNKKDWGIIQTAFWGYSTLITLITVILALIPSNTNNRSSLDPLTGIIIFGPLFIFWILVILQRKHYVWNWWKIALVGNSLLYSIVILIGTTSTNSSPTTDGINLFGLLPLIVIFISLIILGREQITVKE
jgi:drug/metabolite transporter (DMT)-like permease